MNLSILPKKHEPYVVLVTKTHLVWTGGVLKEPVLMEMPEDVMHDLEIVNAKGLENVIQSWMDQNSIVPGNIFLVFSSDLTFAQQFEAGTQDAQQQYLSMIPFDETISKIIPETSNVTLVAISHDLVMPLVRIVEILGFHVVRAYPDILLGNPIAAAEQFTNQVAKTYIDKPENYANQSFYTQPKLIEGVGSIRHSDGRIFTPKLIGMMTIFSGLIAFLLALLYMNGYLGGAPAVSKQLVPVAPAPIVDEIIPTSAPRPEATLTVTASAEVNQQYEIEILINNESELVSENLEEQLELAGFTSITISQSQVASTNSLILVHPAVPPGIRTQVTEIIEELVGSVSIQESNELLINQVRITLGT